MKPAKERSGRRRLILFCLVIAAYWPASPAGEAAAPAFEGRGLILECEDEQTIVELDGGAEALALDGSTRRDWFRLRLSFAAGARETGGLRALALVVHEVDQEREDLNQQRAEHWPAPGGAGVAVATARFDAQQRAWIVRSALDASRASLPEFVSEEFLRKSLGALVVTPPVWDPESATTAVKRTGRWRRIGATELLAEVSQVWSRHAPEPGGLIALGWQGQLTILDPSARKEERRIGSGTASESGSIDQGLGLYQDLTQAWDVRFKLGGDQYAWRHRCTTRVVPHADSRTEK